MRNKNLNVNSVFFVLLFIAIIILSAQSIYAREAAFDDGGGEPPTSKSSYQKVLDSNEESVRKVLDLFNTNPSEYEIPPTAIPTQAEQGPTTTQPQYGPLPQGTTGLSQIIEKITSLIYSNCTTFGMGIVKKQNSYCVDSIKNLFPDTTGDEITRDLKTSANAFSHLQCVGCAVAMSNLNKTYYGGKGNAKQHVGQDVPGYTYYSSFSQETAYKVVPGSFFVIGNGTYGHIGTVTDINKDTAGKVISFRTQECSVKSLGHFEYGRNRTVSEVSGFQIPN